MDEMNQRKKERKKLLSPTVNISTLKSYQIRGCNRDSSAVQAGDESSRTTLWFPLTIVV